MGIDWAHQAGELLLTIIYVCVGLALFGLSIWLMDKFSPFSIRKEIEEDQNVALAILMGSVLIGLSMILMAAIK